MMQTRPKLRMSIAALAVACHALSAHGMGLTFDLADPIFNLDPFSAFALENSTVDDLWFSRTNFGAGGSVLESGAGTVPEDSPLLTQTVGGLTPGVSYDVYGVFWADTGSNFSIQAGVVGGSGLTTYSYRGEEGADGIPGALKGTTAAAAHWDSIPPPTIESTIFTQRPADPLIMQLGFAGTTTADGSGQIQVLIDDLNWQGGGRVGERRTWFDGIAYVESGTAVALEATIDRTTGELRLDNPTGTAFQNIKSVSVRSAFGSLDATEWDPITGRLDGGGTGSFDLDNWEVLSPVDPAATPFTNEIAEAETDLGDGMGGSLSSASGIDFGNVYLDSPFQDIEIHLTYTDDTIAIISPTYEGGSDIPVGSFDGDGDVDLDDYHVLLTNINAGNLSATLHEAYSLGDLDQSMTVDYADFVLFRQIYADVNGAAALADLTPVSAPEPTGLMLLCLASLGAFQVARRRSSVCALLVAVALSGLLTSPTYADDLLAIDFGERGSGDANDPTPGYELFELPLVDENEVAIADPVTVAINGLDALSYSVTVAPIESGVDQNNITEGIQDTPAVLDDRDRSANLNDTLRQVYDDFIFVNNSPGTTGGMDVTISGGSLLPNGLYEITLYSYDSSSTPTRVSEWFNPVQSTSTPALTASFDGAVFPVDDESYRFQGIAYTDANGELILQGRSGQLTYSPSNGNARPEVFLNGLEVSEFSGLTLEVNTSTGEVAIVNGQDEAIDLSYYEIQSESGQFTGSWASLDSGEGGDPEGSGWDEAAASSINLLSELNLTSSLSLPSTNSHSLGSPFAIGGTEDLRFLFGGPGDASLRHGMVTYVSEPIEGLPGDFNNDGEVDSVDYAVWRENLGGDESALNGNGDGIGVVDQQDFALWLSGYGATATPGGSEAVGAPEPGALLLLSILAFGALRTPRNG